MVEPLAPTNLTDPDNTQDYEHHLVYQKISINDCFQLYGIFLDVDSNIYIFSLSENDTHGFFCVQGTEEYII